MALCSHTSCLGDYCRHSPLHENYDAPRCAECGEPERSLIHSSQPIADSLDGADELCHSFIAE